MGKGLTYFSLQHAFYGRLVSGGGPLGPTHPSEQIHTNENPTHPHNVSAFSGTQARTKALLCKVLLAPREQLFGELVALRQR
jgi:hypothetical protein